MATTTKLSVLIETLYKGQGTKAAKKDIAGLEKSVSKSDKAITTAKAGFAKMAMAAGVAGVAMIALKKTWDFAKEGAQLTKVRDTFDSLTASIGTTSEAMLRKPARPLRPLLSCPQGIRWSGAGSTSLCSA